MSLDYLILPDARDDIDDAYAWYETQTVGRGDQFLTELHDMIAALRATPEQYGFVSDPLRAALLPLSKYIVYYTIEPDRIEIVGVIHANADPQKWRNRI
jgi:plasmid stabilization system protein ParE